MANIVTKQNFKNLLPYLPDGVRGLAEGLFRNLPRDVQMADSLALYTAVAVHTIVEISDVTGAYPLLVVAKSGGTACFVKLYLDDSADVTVGTTSAHLSLAVSATAGEVTGALALGAGMRTLATEDGLSIAAPATDVGTGAVANDPTVYVLYHAAA